MYKIKTLFIDISNFIDFKRKDNNTYSDTDFLISKSNTAW